MADASSWFAAQGWTPFDFQREVWAAMADGRSGLLHATTGSGKTYAVWLGALQRAQLVQTHPAGGLGRSASSAVDHADARTGGRHHARAAAAAGRAGAALARRSTYR